MLMYGLKPVGIVSVGLVRGIDEECRGVVFMFGRTMGSLCGD